VNYAKNGGILTDLRLLRHYGRDPVPLLQQIVEMDLAKNGEIRNVLAVPAEQGRKGDGT